MKDSRRIKRFLSSLLAAAMLLILFTGAVPAFAEGDEDPATDVGEDSGNPFNWEQYTVDELKEIIDSLEYAILRAMSSRACEKSGRAVVFEYDMVIAYTGRICSLAYRIEESGEETDKAEAESEIPSLRWRSVDPDVAAVDANGVVTGVAPGKTYVWCSSADGTLFGFVPVTVRIPVGELILSADRTELLLGGRYSDASVQLNVSILPEEAFTREVLWESSDETVATVDSSGKVKAVKAGTATITAVSAEKGTLSPVTAACEVTVKQAATGLKLDKTGFSMNVKEKAQITAAVMPDDTSNKNLVWSSSDTKVATVDKNGRVTAVGPGAATITCSTADGSKLSRTCTVRVVRKVSSLRIDQKDILLYVRDKQKLTASVGPSDATNKKVSWTSSDNSIVKVDLNGNIEALRAGTATIVCSAEDGSGKTASVRVTVKEFTAQDVAKEIGEQVAGPAKAYESYGVTYKISVTDSETVNADVYVNNLSLLMTLAKAGNKDAKEKWTMIISTFEQVSASAQQSADAKATDKVNVIITVYDSGRKATKGAAFWNGKTYYDAVNGINRPFPF